MASFMALRKSHLVTYIPSVCQFRFRWFRTRLYCLFDNSDTGTIFESSRFQRHEYLTSFWCFVQFFGTCLLTNLLRLQCTWRWRVEAIFVVMKLSFIVVEDVWVVGVLFGDLLNWEPYLIGVWFGEDLQRANSKGTCLKEMGWLPVTQINSLWTRII